jgi:SAM-dependent methyltransferase
MVLLSADKIAKQIAVNQLQKVGPVQWLKRSVGRHRGGNAHDHMPDDLAIAYNRHAFTRIRPFAGDLAGKRVLEIGPGDNVGVAYAFLRSGCAKVIAVERITDIQIDERAARILRRIDAMLPGSGPTFDQVARREGSRYVLDPARFEIRREAFEDLDPGGPLDVVYSNDVMEHVDDPRAVFRAAHRLLAPGGLFINNVDLSGHNCFANPERPLDFLTCDDKLWTAMFSNVVTTNRVRYSDLVAAAEAAGFRVKDTRVVRKVEPAYLAEIRPHLLPRYQALSDDDLSIVQCVLVAER